MNQAELKKLIKKYDLQYYDEENLLKRTDFLIERYSSNIFSLDVSKVDELSLIAKTITNIHMHRSTNWKILGKTSAPYEYDIDHRGAIVKFKLLNIRTYGNKKPIKILGCIAQTSAADFQQYKDKQVLIIGDLNFLDDEVIVDVKSIIKADDKYMKRSEEK